MQKLPNRMRIFQMHSRSEWWNGSRVCSAWTQKATLQTIDEYAHTTGQRWFIWNSLWLCTSYARFIYKTCKLQSHAPSATLKFIWNGDFRWQIVENTRHQLMINMPIHVLHPLWLPSARCSQDAIRESWFKAWELMENVSRKRWCRNDRTQEYSEKHVYAAAVRWKAATHAQHWNFQNDSVDLSSACWITLIAMDPVGVHFFRCSPSSTQKRTFQDNI